MVMDHIPDEPGEATEKPRKKRRIPNTPRVKEHRATMANMMSTVGRTLPQCPTNPDELAFHWQIPSDELIQVSVKVLRAVKGTRDEELVDEVAGTDFNLGPIAGRFGPGLYFIRGGGRYSAKIAKVPISEELARKHGFGRAPDLPSAADLAAQRTISEAAKKPTDPLDLAAAMELAAKRAAREAFQEFLPQLNAAGSPARVMSPTDTMGQFREMMGFMNGIREDVRRDVERSMGISKPEPEEPAPWWAPIVQSLGPVLQSILASRQASAVLHQPPATPPATPAPALGMAHPSAPSVEPAMNKPSLPQLTPQEQAIATPAVKALQPWAAQLLQLGAQPITAEEASAELVGLIPPVFYDSLIQFDELAQVKGSSLLGYIHPEMATDRWCEILHVLAENLKRDEP